MKKTSVYILLAIIICAGLSGCNASTAPKSIWETAAYKDNTELGEGSKTLVVAVIAEDKTVELTVHSDKETVGAALTEHGLIAGEQGPYGLYVKTVNGMLADYDISKTYWSFTKDGEAMMQGVDTTDLENGAHYEFTLTK